MYAFSEDICNDQNENRVADFCVRLSGRTEPNMVNFIKTNSKCAPKNVKLTSESEGTPHYYEKTVGFCEMGFPSPVRKCITKSEGEDDLLVWDFEGQPGYQYCAPKYEKTGWFA